MKFFSIFAFIASAFSDEETKDMSEENTHVNKTEAWNSMVSKIDSKTLKVECAAFKQGRSYVPETPDFCPGAPKNYQGTAFDDQIMLISAADSYGCWCDIAQWFNFLQS